MKKITSFLLGSFAFLSAANAQMVVDANDFFNNPSKYNGRTIVIKDITVRKAAPLGASITPSGTTAPGSPVGPAGSPTGGLITPSGVTGGSTPGSSTPSAPAAMRCNPPRNFEQLEVIFPNAQSKGCFVILSKMASPIPNNKDVIATITFKADTRLLNKITMIKFIP